MDPRTRSLHYTLLSGFMLLLCSCSAMDRRAQSLDLRIAIALARQREQITLARYLADDPNLAVALKLLRANGIRCGALCSVSCELIVFADGATKALATLKADSRVARSLLFREEWRTNGDQGVIVK